MRTRKVTRLLAVIVALGLVLTACGGKGKGGDDTQAAKGVAGGTFRIAAGDDVDHIDPGQIYYTFSYMLFRVMIRNLVNYPAIPGMAGNIIVPDIAAEKPAVSADAKTYTFTIKPGVKYQPEAADGREVRSADFRYAIERGFYKSVSNGYANLYFANLFAGDEAFLKAPGPNVHITGINVSDPQKITFTLKRPTGDFLYRLALPLAAPVPEEYAKPLDARTPSAYGPNFASTGPYQLERDSAGKVSGYVAKKKIHMVRNKNWSKATDPIRLAFPDRFEVTEGFEDTVVATDKILAGDYDYNGDFTIPPEKIRTIVANPDQKTRIHFNPTNCFYYVSLNTRIKPFDNQLVRQAVAYVLNRQGMRLTRGGERVGEIATHTLIPGINGFEESGGREYDPYPSRNFEGDVTKAKELMVKAGYPSGMYEGRPVFMVSTSTGDVAVKTANVVQSSLEKIGIKVRRQAFGASTMYTQYYQVPDQDVAVAPNAAWCWDFPDSSTIIKALFDGRDIRPQGNNNYAELNDPALNTLIDQALVATGAKRAKLWADANKRVMELSPVIPWLWDAQPNLISSRVVGYQFTLSSSTIDLAVVSLKPEKK